MYSSAGAFNLMNYNSAESDSSIAATNKVLEVGGAEPFWSGTAADLEPWQFGGAQ